MIRFFKSTQAATLFIIPVIVLLLWFQAFFGTSFVLEKGMLLQNSVINLIAIFPRFLQVLSVAALVIAEAIYLNLLINRYEVLYKNSYLPALMYVLLMSFATPLLQFHPVILSNLFLIAALDKMFSLFKNESPISPLFTSGFFISLASLIYYPASSFFILLLLALVTLRSFNFREWTIALIGFGLPYFFASVYFFWSDQLSSGWKKIMANFIPFSSRFDFTIGKPLLFIFILFGLLTVLSINRLRKNFYKNIIRTRANQQILVLYFLIAAISSVLLKRIPVYQLTLLAVPLSVFFSYYFLAEKKRPWLSELIVWVMIALIVWNHF